MDYVNPLLFMTLLILNQTTMSPTALIDSNLADLYLISKGKVRDIYATSDPNLLLFVASDRISAYDVILRNVRSILAANSSTS